MMWSRITRIARVQRAFGFAIWACLATALLAFAPAAWAAEFTFKGQKVEYENAEYKEIVDATTGDTLPVLIFRENGWFKPSKTATGRALVVGGGGAGGYGSTLATNPGGGGGGGEVKDQEGLAYLENVTHSITVGVGGAQTTAAGNGENGHPSVITAGETALVSAFGGGGGGAKNPGNGGDGVATGGGGGGNGKLGGVGALGEDHKGGKAGTANRSGGGGGAGGPGADTSTTKVGDGGAGVNVDIEVWAPETIGITTSFGGGGGGGATTAAGQGEGNDGGGNGGRLNLAPEAGTPNTGGGGGGGGRCTATHASKAFYGGAGGSGIVVIRFEDIEATINWVEIPVKIGGQATEGKVFVDENSSWRWVGNDLVIAYSNTTTKGGLRFFDPENPDLPPVWANARILAVGGGGGGGMIDVRSVGAGAGGGAGGFVERDGLVFDNQVEYQVTVGAGGLGGKTNEEAGKNGKDSSITTNGAEVIEAAIGGGGGGAHSVGEAGGSGGGGSRALTTDERGLYDRVGGAGTSGQGFGGGEGAGTYRGAGGGGAGGAGGDATSSVTGDGGVGKESDITGSSIFYAGGGGGATISVSESGTNSGGAGGSGGGGNGAGVANDVAAVAQNGVDGLGGGGGGGVSYKGAPEVAGNGGSGVVIIRLSGFVVRSVPVPKTTNFVFDGHSKTGVVEFYAYELTGTPVADNADVYTVYAKIKPQYSFEWDDATGGQGERKLTWHIAQMPVTVPSVTPSYVYDAEVHYAVDPKRYLIDADGYCHQTNAGLDHAYCKVEGNAQTEANPKGESYTVTISLSRLDLRGGPATNYVWNLPRTMADQLRDWRITQASNAIVGLDYPCRNLARLEPPLNCFTCDWPKKASMVIGDNVVVEYRPVDNEEGWVAWGSATEGGPTSKGSYVIRVKIPETDNWQGDSAEMTFGTWNKPSDIFSDQLKF